MNLLRALIFCYVIIQTAQAQWSHQLIFFKNNYRKSEPALSAKALERRRRFQIELQATDYAIHDSAIRSLERLFPGNFIVMGRSRWLNAIHVICKEDVRLQLANIPLLKDIVAGGTFYPFTIDKTTNELDEIENHLADLEKQFIQNGDSTRYGKSKQQLSLLHVPAMHALGYTGKNITIAVCDAGYRNIRSNPFFDAMFKQQRVIDTINFLYPGKSVLDMDDHGTAVVSCMGAKAPGWFLGTSPDARFILCKTEDPAHELPYEEWNLLQAMEYADSAGADIIHASVGYNQFDDKQFNYRTKSLNGKTSIASRAATMAQRKGILVVCSAGNEGDDSWKMITTPADADSILSVGACNLQGKISPFSSFGPTSDKRIKPEIIAPGEDVFVADGVSNLHRDNGTSFAAPLISGLAACLWQAVPSAKPHQIIDALELSASMALNPSNQTGYGIPNAEWALEILQKRTQDTVVMHQVNAQQNCEWIVYSAQAQKIQIQYSFSDGTVFKTDKIKLKKSGYHRFESISLKKQKNMLLIAEIQMQNATFFRKIILQ